MRKILFISNISKKINSFSLASITAAKELDLEFYHAANWAGAEKQQIRNDELEYGIHINHVDISRSPFSLNNIKAYKQIVELIKREKIDYIHCNTPVGGLLGRLAGRKCKVKRVIYQVHGFHFYKDAPLLNWLIYYPIEKLLARFTDAIITINKEDYEMAKNFKLYHNGNIHMVHGVGMDVQNISNHLKPAVSFRSQIGIGKNDIILISVGELNRNKNQRVIIEALSRLENSNIHFVLCGVGECQKDLEVLSENRGISSRVHFLGYRSDINDVLVESDIFVLPSYREGLSRSLMEAMACGLPCIVSKIRGNEDLLIDNKGGFLCNPNKVEEFTEAIGKLVREVELREEMKIYNLEKIREYDSAIVKKEMLNIYREYI